MSNTPVSTDHSAPTTNQLIELVAEIITPLLKDHRTMVMPFNRYRHENVGEHSFSIGLLACALAPKVAPYLNIGLVAQYAIVHDVAEVYTGDVTVWEPDEVLSSKPQNAAQAAGRIHEQFPHFSWISKTHLDYLAQDTPEKKFVYAVDKLYPHVMILHGNFHPVRPSWEAYLRTEVIARSKVATFPELLPLFDDLCRRFRQNPEFFSTPIAPEHLT
jgi:5'-deoxynucleotidase YfbR-like HD superfamily hydrolase